MFDKYKHKIFNLLCKYWCVLLQCSYILFLKDAWESYYISSAPCSLGVCC